MPRRPFAPRVRSGRIPPRARNHGMRSRDTRREENQKLFRRGNERLHDAPENHITNWTHVPFLCECAAEACAGTVEVQLAEWEAVASKPNHFLTGRGTPAQRGQAGGRVVERVRRRTKAGPTYAEGTSRASRRAVISEVDLGEVMGHNRVDPRAPLPPPISDGKALSRWGSPASGPHGAGLPHVSQGSAPFGIYEDTGSDLRQVRGLLRHRHGIGNGQSDPALLRGSNGRSLCSGLQPRPGWGRWTMRKTGAWAAQAPGFPRSEEW